MLSTSRAALIAANVSTGTRPRSCPERGFRVHELPAHFSSPRAARVLVRDTCARWDLDEMSETAALVATELVTNAVQHAHTRSLLQLVVDRGSLRLAVRDFRRAPPDPRPRPVDVTRAGGRGLHLVALLVAAWGVLDHPDGKTTWAQLRRASPGDRDR